MIDKGAVLALGAGSKGFVACTIFCADDVNGMVSLLPRHAVEQKNLTSSVPFHSSIMLCAQLVDDKLDSETSKEVRSKLRLYRERLFYEWLRMFEEWEVYNCYKNINVCKNENGDTNATTCNADDEILRHDSSINIKDEFGGRYHDDDISYQ